MSENITPESRYIADQIKLVKLALHAQEVHPKRAHEILITLIHDTFELLQVLTLQNYAIAAEKEEQAKRQGELMAGVSYYNDHLLNLTVDKAMDNLRRRGEKGIALKKMHDALKKLESDS